jgi:integrase
LPHRVPLTATALAVLRPLYDADAIHVFAGIRGPRHRRGVLEDLPVADVRPHDFRRTAATMMASAGVSRLVIGKVLNLITADATVTAIYDRHSYDSEKRIALETWERTLIGILKKKPMGKVRAFARRR